MNPQAPAGVAELWQAFATVSAAQKDAIDAGDADALDALLTEKDRLLQALARRDVTRDATRDPSLLPLIEAVQQHEQAAGLAFAEARAQLGRKIAALREQRAAGKAFGQSAPKAPEQQEPRFFDQHG